LPGGIAQGIIWQAGSINKIQAQTTPEIRLRLLFSASAGNSWIMVPN